MKSDKEFINEVYKKYEQYQKDNIKEKNSTKVINYKKISKFAGIAAVFVISVITLTSFNNINEINTKEPIQEPVIEEISLATVNNFENLYNLLKENASNNTSGFNSDAVIQDTIAESKSSQTTNNVRESATLDEDYSKTNTQEENVDEADIVKIDGNYIYTISNQKVVIVDIKDSNNMKVMSEIKFENDIYPTELYINKDKLVVLGNSYTTAIKSTVTYDLIDRIAEYGKSTLIIFDIQDRTNPKEIRRVEIEGNYISSRMIDDNIYFVTNRYLYTSQITRYAYTELKEEDYKPKYTDSVIGEEKQVNFNDIYYFEDIKSTNYLILSGINLNNTEEAEIKTFLGAGEKIYCSEKNMFIVKTSNVINRETNEIIDTYTKILKFSLNGGKINFKAEQDIQGYINNQFSMSEANGYFRIATTSGIQWNLTDETTNTLYILDENLEEVGKLGGLAKGEKIYSVRYVDNKAYIVTFKEVDPLFVIDLSNPKEPAVLGELKIPGYSTYLHPYDENHLIGFGYDTKENGTRIISNGLKMVMFDVTDLSNPKELFKVNIGDRYTHSELTYNHKALLYLKEQNIIAFPIDKYSNKTEFKALIYQIDLEKGFVLQGEVVSTHGRNGNYRINRIVYSNGEFYTVSYNQIKAFKARKLY